MPAIRKTNYRLSNLDKKFLLNYCRSKDADINLIRQCAEVSNSSISDYLVLSVTKKKSYERLGYVPITKGDFYAYRRKLLAELKIRLNKRPL